MVVCCVALLTRQDPVHVAAPAAGLGGPGGAGAAGRGRARHLQRVLYQTLPGDARQLPPGEPRLHRNQHPRPSLEVTLQQLYRADQRYRLGRSEEGGQDGD